MIKGIEKSLVIWSFCMPFKRMLETISPISSPMNIVNRGVGAGGTIYPRVMSHPQPSCMLSFYVMIKGIEKSLVIWSFCMPFKRMLETISPISSPMNIVNRGVGAGGTIYPRVMFHPQPSCMLSFYVMIKGIEKSLVIWSFWMPFKRMLETISHISSLWT